MQPEPDIFVCIVTYRRLGSLAGLLRSLDRQEGALPSLAPFHPRMALTDGDDVDLFDRMIRGGAMLISIAAPAIQNRRPAARANALWLLRRRFHVGGTNAHIEWRGRGRATRAGGLIYPEYVRPS